MKDNILNIDCGKEKARIVNFLKDTFEKQNIQNAVIGLSGGVDSAVSFYLLREVLRSENIFVMHLYYSQPTLSMVEPILKDYEIPEKNIQILSIKSCVDELIKTLGIESNEESKIRIGNIMARTRMIALFDLAKKNNALVCGTENKSEKLLGYFTRFGDQASDIEPISHLYKTQVFQLALFLDIPGDIIKQKPTAGLWEGQTDEGEFGFTYEEADQVLRLYFDKHYSKDDIIKKGFKSAEKIISLMKRNEFKQKTPYYIL